jgi:hypothetical protein
MAYDEGLAELMRGDLAEEPGVTEKKMFGGLCFMLDGNMVCGVHKGGGMFRVGKDGDAVALGIEGVSPMAFTGRQMAGFVDVTDDCVCDDTRRARLMAMALGYVRALPAK